MCVALVGSIDPDTSVRPIIIQEMLFREVLRYWRASSQRLIIIDF